MSIITRLDELIAAGLLVDRPSSFLRLSARSMFVTPEIKALATHPFPDNIEGERYAELAQYLDAFCEHNEITVAEVPDNKPHDVMLARVKPVEDDFWSMRITDPENTPGMRILGAFCDLDSFVGLLCDFRENIRDFDDEVELVRESWKLYFGGLRPHTGRTLDEYLTNYLKF